MTEDQIIEWLDALANHAVVAALLRLRYDVDGIEASAFVGDKIRADVIRLIDQHIEKYRD